MHNLPNYGQPESHFFGVWTQLNLQFTEDLCLFVLISISIFFFPFFLFVAKINISTHFSKEENGKNRGGGVGLGQVRCQLATRVPNSKLSNMHGVTYVM